MPEEPKKDTGTSQNISGLVALVLLAAGVVVHQFGPLESLRPVSQERVVRDLPPLQSVPSRLWQDPLAAMYEAGLGDKQATGEKTSPVPRSFDDINQMIREYLERQHLIKLYDGHSDTVSRSDR